MSVMPIFISPKGFDREHIRIIQTNAIQSWKQLGEAVQIILMGKDQGVAEAAAALDVKYIPDIQRNSSGTPLLSDMFRLAREVSDTPLLAYVNADIILFNDFLQKAQMMMDSGKEFLLVGQRWDLSMDVPIDFTDHWQEKLRAEIKERGRRHPAGGSDYFIYPRTIFTKIPDFAIGRSGWDNWMFYEARYRGWKMIDCSEAIDIIHQDHDYAHLPGGLPHYRQTETKENVKAAGGKRRIFSLRDCNWKMNRNDSIVRVPMTKEKIIREIEIFPLVTLKSDALGEAAFALFHPKKAYSELRNQEKKK